MWPERCNLPICWVGLRGARSRGNTKCSVTLGFDGTVEDIYMVMTSKQAVTTDMKNKTLQGGDSYPSRLAGIKGGQLRSHQVRRRRRRRRRRRKRRSSSSSSAVN
jgi:hypothetical protein